MADPNAFEVIYSRQAGDFIKGKVYSNPRFYQGARAGVTKVYIVGDWPQIEADYRKAGVPVESMDALAALAVDRAPALAVPAPPIVPEVSTAERAGIDIPDGWRDLPWTKPIDGGQTLRGLGSLFSDAPVLNKAHAVAAIEGELSRRGEGLTDREIIADLEAAGVEFDPRASRDERAALRATARG